MINFLYVTTGSKLEALKIGRVLVEERIAACVNVIENMTSLYWWEGNIEEGHETILIVKTDEQYNDSAMQRIKELHSYECPCILVLPVSNGYKEYVEWLYKELG